MADSDTHSFSHRRPASRRKHAEYPANNLPHQEHESVTFQRQSGGTAEIALRDFWSKFTRKHNVGVLDSIKAIVLSSWLNLFVILIPVAWVAHFQFKANHWPASSAFTLCFLAIIPLERLFDYGGEQMSFYLGKQLGDLFVITLNNAVEATLAIILLAKGELKLLQSTVVGVVILHLLLIPGTSFMIGGARIMHQHLHPHYTQLNQTLLSIGVLTLLIPAAFFAALDRTTVSDVRLNTTPILSDASRHIFLSLSRGLAVILLILYTLSRIFLLNPPGEDEEELSQTALHDHSKEHEDEPEVNQYVCVVMLVISIGLMAATAEWLVESVEFVREDSHIQEEWFGLILLPFLSFAADGAVAVVYFIRHLIRHFFRGPEPPNIVAKSRAIDLSIQFLLFWMPFFILLGWWTDKPLSLLFDFFEISILIGACFIVNYVTADSRTNWAEGVAMVSFYFMIALCAWFYPGQPEIKIMLFDGTVEQGLMHAASGGE
ncbi:hypothetical protein AX17_001072 [Amanita inopinata Kibby_2008]|nr:hypothetical protein AX17_001072 [Amanita inopinata Kibby_2008]